VQTQHGPVIAIMHQYTLLGKGASIHSPSQLNGTRMTLMTSPSMFLVVFNVLPPWKVTSFLWALKMVSGALIFVRIPIMSLTLCHMSFSPRNWSGILPSLTIRITIPRNGETKLLLLMAPYVTHAMMSLVNIAKGFLSTICCTSHAKMVRLWMTILISAFSLHINRP
jgi:hypothetical protein